jgi:hypothetical protein
MIARPKISQNEWKATERGAFEVGKVALVSRPGEDREALPGRGREDVALGVDVADVDPADAAVAAAEVVHVGVEEAEAERRRGAAAARQRGERARPQVVDRRARYVRREELEPVGAEIREDAPHGRVARVPREERDVARAACVELTSSIRLRRAHTRPF